MVTIRTTSHRSRDRLRRAINAGSEHYTWTDRGARNGYYVIDALDLPVALMIKGITEVKRDIVLHPCFSI